MTGLRDGPTTATRASAVGTGPVPPAPAAPRGGRASPPQQSLGHDGPYDSGYNTGQVYGIPPRPAGRARAAAAAPYGTGQGSGGPGRAGGPGGPGGARPAPDWRRRIKIGSITVAAVLVVTTVATYFWADGRMRREVALSKVIERPEEGACIDVPDRGLGQP